MVDKNYDMITTGEVAELLDVCYATVYHWIERGVIKPVYTLPSGRKKFSRTQILELCEKMGRKTKNDFGINIKNDF